jgi:hypothetical protein
MGSSGAPLWHPHFNSPAMQLAYVPCPLHQGNLGNAAARVTTSELAVSLTLHSAVVQRTWPAYLAHVWLSDVYDVLCLLTADAPKPKKHTVMHLWPTFHKRSKFSGMWVVPNISKDHSVFMCSVKQWNLSEPLILHKVLIIHIANMWATTPHNMLGKYQTTFAHWAH